ncbi:MAG: inorganic phosphate transporter [Candidatus Nanoarchaeia archaeon]|nr:inorganic phosphate transporter [Candidatus Nanoarchaeia archaeon]MDD5741639.1 inorganic phosphate transporter [Candidatus Nanoarchaeia archaeon]
MISLFILFLIGFALLFDFLNGFHDSANSIATVVVTRTLTPLQAVILAGIANFSGYFIFGVAIANTIGQGIVNLKYMSLTIVFAALIGAVIWNIITWFLGLPTSSSHALIGGLIGAAVASAGFNAVVIGGFLKVFSFIFLAPLIGFAGAIIFTVLILIIFRKSNRTKSNKWFRWLQLCSSAFYSLGHGTNDAQKTMGIIALILFSSSLITSFYVPRWVVFSCLASISIGTMLGGWRIVKTMGTKISKIHAMEGFCAETSSALVLLGTAHTGIPVSTTHVIAGSIMGVGSVEKARSVKWIMARKILLAWLLTIPITAFISAVIYLFASILM